MASLDRSLRKDLETTVKKARRVAEAGARKAVAQLGVGEAEAPKHLSPNSARSAIGSARMAGSLATGATQRRARKTPRVSCRNAPTSTGTACCSRASWPRPTS